jgi:hypothetical protein
MYGGCALHKRRLGPMAVEFRLDHWHLGRTESAGNRRHATNLRAGGTQIHQTSDDLRVLGSEVVAS